MHRFEDKKVENFSSGIKNRNSIKSNRDRDHTYTCIVFFIWYVAPELIQ